MPSIRCRFLTNCESFIPRWPECQYTFYTFTDILHRILLLRSPYAVAGWLPWLDYEMNAAIGVFNKTIMHQVVSDAKQSQKAKTKAKLEMTKALDAVISKTQASDSSSSDEVSNRLDEKEMMARLYPDKTGVLFARFIFDFGTLFEPLQDLHIVPVAALEAAQVLKRLRVPKTPPLDCKEQTVTAKGGS
jgi:hypothetical protein